jgi:hypothetical protein
MELWPFNYHKTWKMGRIRVQSEVNKLVKEFITSLHNRQRSYSRFTNKWICDESWHRILLSEHPQLSFEFGVRHTKKAFNLLIGEFGVPSFDHIYTKQFQQIWVDLWHPSVDLWHPSVDLWPPSVDLWHRSICDTHRSICDIHRSICGVSGRERTLFQPSWDRSKRVMVMIDGWGLRDTLHNVHITRRTQEMDT